MCCVHIDKTLFLNWLKKCYQVTQERYDNDKSKAFNSILEKSKNIPWYIRPFYETYNSVEEIEQKFSKGLYGYLPEELDRLKIKEFKRNDILSRLRTLSSYELNSSDILEVSPKEIDFLRNICSID